VLLRASYGRSNGACGDLPVHGEWRSLLADREDRACLVTKKGRRKKSGKKTSPPQPQVATRSSASPTARTARTARLTNPETSAARGIDLTRPAAELPRR